MKKTVLGKIIEQFDKQIEMYKSNPEISAAFENARLTAMLHLPEERENMQDAYNSGNEKGWYDFKRTHGISSNMKPDKFRVDLFYKQYFNENYEQ